MRKHWKTLGKKVLATAMVCAMGISVMGCGASKDAGSSSSGSSSSSASVDQSKLDSYNSPKIKAIQKAGKLVLGTASGYPPYEFASVDNGGQIIGIDIAFAQAVADGLGVSLEVQDMPFSETITSLQGGITDMVFAGTTETEERAQIVDFTDVYIEDKFVVIVRKEDADKYSSMADLAGKTIAAELGSSTEAVAKEELTDSKFTSLSLNADCFTELANGKVDAVVNSKVVAQQYAVANPDFTILDLTFKTPNKNCQGCVAKGDEGFLKYVNDVIAQNKDNGNFDKWIQEYSEQSAKEAQ